MLKTIKEIINTEPFFSGEFKNEEDVITEFRIKKEDLKGYKILFAQYNYIMYEGEAFVLLAKKGKIYEVNGSHCSCYGLEGQWSVEEANRKELWGRVNRKTYLAPHWNENFKKFLTKD